LIGRLAEPILAYDSSFESPKRPPDEKILRFLIFVFDFKKIRPEDLPTNGVDL
jgi:hypothetical protein